VQVIEVVLPVSSTVGISMDLGQVLLMRHAEKPADPLNPDLSSTVTSSGASRLKPEGISVHEKIAATIWFLNGKDDARWSYYLEDPATECDIQGLELDWVGVRWEQIFRSNDGSWCYHSFRGTVWQNVIQNAQQVFLTNAYRVLLTRARQGMVIYILEGDANDKTRLPEFYDGTFNFLKSCAALTAPAAKPNQ
jgi:hypothetical protein